MGAQFYVLTGGPGAGKTTVLAELRRRGYDCVDEVGREVIREQVASEGEALPWLDKVAFRALMLERSIETYREAQNLRKPVFFDRGIPDLFGYSDIEALKIDGELKDAVKLYRYEKRVFIFPPWKEIYCCDEERKQSFEVASATYDAMKRAYRGLDYTLKIVDCNPVGERVDALLGELNLPFHAVV